MRKFYLIRSKKGAVMAEFALSIPILLTILFFIIEFGNILYLSNTLNQVARSAVRYAAMNPSATTTQLATAAGASSSLPNATDLTLVVSPTAGTSRSVGDTITVTASWNYTPFINPFGFLSPGTAWSPSIMTTAIGRVEVAS